MDRAVLKGSPDGGDLTTDLMLGGAVRLLQPKMGYRAAIDPVLLAAAVSAGPGERVLELGCGVGTVSLCLAKRLPFLHVTGIDADAAVVALARSNAAANQLDDRLTFEIGDVATLDDAVAGGGFDQVVANPPFLPAQRATMPNSAFAQTSEIEGDAGLDLWLTAMLRMVRPKGRLTLIHRADRLDEILQELAGRAGDIRLFPLWPRQGSQAKRIIVAARRGVRSPMRLQPGLILHHGDAFTPEADRVLRGGHGIEGLWG